jgi:hypothetical protein
LFSCHFQRFLSTQVMCLHFVQGPEMTHSYSISILSLQLTLLIEKMLPLGASLLVPRGYMPSWGPDLVNKLILFYSLKSPRNSECKLAHIYGMNKGKFFIILFNALLRVLNRFSWPRSSHCSDLDPDTISNDIIITFLV